jgi:hypothetical protein
MVGKRSDLEIRGARTVRRSRLARARSEKGVGMRRDGSRVPIVRHAHLSSEVRCGGWAEEELGLE